MEDIAKEKIPKKTLNIPYSYPTAEWNAKNQSAQGLQQETGMEEKSVQTIMMFTETRKKAGLA